MCLSRRTRKIERRIAVILVGSSVPASLNKFAPWVSGSWINGSQPSRGCQSGFWFDIIQEPLTSVLIWIRIGNSRDPWTYLTEWLNCPHKSGKDVHAQIVHSDILVILQFLPNQAAKARFGRIFKNHWLSGEQGYLTLHGTGFTYIYFH